MYLSNNPEKEVQKHCVSNKLINEPNVIKDGWECVRLKMNFEFTFFECQVFCSFH